VQGFQSSQSGATPATQLGLSHRSGPLQALPSSHCQSEVQDWQTVSAPSTAPSQSLSSPSAQVAEPSGPSVAPGWMVLFWSSQSWPQGGGAWPSESASMAWPAQVPPAQASPLVQASRSSHGAVLWLCVQPFASQPSSVQGSPSSQALASGLKTQPAPWSQVSRVQGSPSSQVRGVPWQLAPTQVSPSVQALPSSQPPPVETWEQPCWGSQRSSVQGLPSSQRSRHERQACGEPSAVSQPGLASQSP